MVTGKTSLRKTAVALVTTAVLSAAPVFANGPTQAQKENPSFFAMAGDLAIVRPLMLATTVVGGAVFIVSAPFSAIGGNIAQSGRTLVAQPFKATFVRCLGCSFPSEEGL